MIKMLMLAMGAVLVYLGASGSYKQVGSILGVGVKK
jgi:hypothetical protein